MILISKEFKYIKDDITIAYKFIPTSNIKSKISVLITKTYEQR